MMKGAVTTNLTRSGYIHTLRLNADRTVLRSLKDWRLKSYNGSLQLLRTRSKPEARELVIERHKLLSGVDAVVASDVIMPDYATNVQEWTNIARVGVELEGGWRNPQTEIHGDGSVSVPCEDNRQGRWCHDCEQTHYSSDSMPYEGEAHTYPTPYNASEPHARDGSDRHGLWKQFLEYYPDKVNATCGLHVHVSFKTAGAYSAFVNNKFEGWLLSGLQAWGDASRGISSNPSYNDWSAFTARINGIADYCGGRYASLQAQAQINARRKYEAERYTAVNYCYGMHGTFEVRVLPMFNEKYAALGAVKELLRLVQLWDNTNGPRVKRPMLLASDQTIAATFTEAATERRAVYRGCSCVICMENRGWNSKHDFDNRREFEILSSYGCQFMRSGLSSVSNGIHTEDEIANCCAVCDNYPCTCNDDEGDDY